MTMDRDSFDSAAKLVRPDRVHKRLYTDQAVFEAEMERLFGRAWLYIGHESQVPKTGDYITTYMGLQPVIMVRDRDRAIHVLHNRCPHRGVMICTDAAGNTGMNFRCGYHGWTFKTNGELLAAPLKNAYEGHCDLKGGEFGMKAVPRVGSYRGFVFASLAPLDEDFPDLKTYLGAGAACIDRIADRSPVGELDVTGGVQKYEIKGNWKAQLENLNDLYHPPYSHECTADKDNRQFRRRHGDAVGVKLDASEQQSVWDQIESVALDYGNSFCGTLPFSQGSRSGPIYEAHRASLMEKHAPEKVDEILTDSFHNVIFYPSVVMQLASHHVRVVRPIAPDRTEVRVYPIRLKGAPTELNRALVRYLNVTHSAASLIQTDDVEMFRRIQAGLAGEGGDWVWFNRHFSGDVDIQEGTKGCGTSDMVMRNQYRAYRDYMSKD
jgi:phenylpropionate dioxygenase-like ring-hydroxylating dioxygenase large terminal subunit